MGSNSSRSSPSSLVTSNVKRPVQKPKKQKPRAGTIQADGTPIPLPPITSKADVLYGIHFDILDEIALHAPLELLLGTFWDVVEHLIITPNGDVLDDLSKARMFFRWMTSFDVYTIDTEIIPPEDSPLEYFMKIQYDLGDHAHMFYSLCKMGDIPCVVIDGMTKGGGYEIGEAVDRDKMQGKWNAVLISGEWRLVDTFWAKVAAPRQSSDVVYVDSEGRITRETEDKNLDFSVNEFFFLCDPDHLIHTHFPDDKDWQLMHDPMDVNAFERNAYVREQYHKLGLSIPSDSIQKNCVIKTQDDAIKIALDIPEESANSVKFKYALLQTRKQVETEKEVDMVFERFVRMEHRKNTLKLKLRFPITGRFMFDLYASDKWSSSTYKLVCTYIIHVSKKTKNHNPFPDCPLFGWGPNPFSDVASLLPITPEETSILTENGICQISVCRKGILDINHALRNVLMDEAVLTKHAIGKFDGDKYIVDIILPEVGEYALKIFASTEQTLPIQSTDLLTFLIKYKSQSGKSSKNTPFPIIASAHVGKKDGYSKLGVQALTYKVEHVDVLEGEGSFVFKTDEKVQLLCELASATKEGQSRLSVNTKQERDRWIFVVDMPISGEYSLNIFAIEKKNPFTLHEVQTYTVQSKGRPIKEVKFTDDFGPDDIVVETIKTSEEKIVISVPNPVDGEVLYANISRRDATKNEGENHATVLIKKDNLEIHLKSDGEYLLEIYEKEQETVVTTIARFTISKSPTFKTYTSDIDALVKMLKPQEKSRKVKNALEQKRQRRLLAKKKKEEELLRKQKEEQKRKDEEAKTKLEKEKQNKKGKNKHHKPPEGKEEGTGELTKDMEERSISPDTLAAALEIAKAAEEEEKAKKMHTRTASGKKRDSSTGLDSQIGDISPERLAAAVALITTTQMNATANTTDTPTDERSNKNTKENGTIHGNGKKKQTLDRQTLNAALSIVAAVEDKSNGITIDETPDIDTGTVEAAREIIALAGEEGMTDGQNLNLADVRKSSNISSVKSNEVADTERITTATAIVMAAKANHLGKGKTQDKANTNSSKKVNHETLAAASAIVAMAKQNAKKRHTETATEGREAGTTRSLHEQGSSDSLSSEVIAAAVSIVSSPHVQVADRTLEANTKTTNKTSLLVGATNEEDIDPETLAAAVALVVASKKHDETVKQKKRNSAKKKAKPENKAAPRKSGHTMKAAAQANSYSQDSIESLYYTKDSSNLLSHVIDSETQAAATAILNSSTNEHKTSNEDSSNSTLNDMTKSSSEVAGPLSTTDQRNTSKSKGAVDNKTELSKANVLSISPYALSAAVALVASTASNTTSALLSKNRNSEGSVETGKAKSSSKSSNEKQTIDPSTLAAATAIIKAAGRTRGISKQNSEAKDVSKNPQGKEHQSDHTHNIDTETLKAAATIVAAASQNRDIENSKHISTDIKDKGVKTSEEKNMKNKKEKGHDETFDFTKDDELSPAALAEASKPIAASISKANDQSANRVNIGQTANYENSKPFQTPPEKDSHRIFSPNTIAAAHAIVDTSKNNNRNQATKVKGVSSGSSSNENRCVSPKTLASALSIISASETRSTPRGKDDKTTTGHGAKKKERTEIMKQTKKGIKKVNVVSGNINMNGAKGRKGSTTTTTTTTPRHNQTTRKGPVSHRGATGEVEENNDDYLSDSTLHSSNFDSLSNSDYDSEEERQAEVTERKKSVAQAMKKKDLKNLVYQLQEFKKTKDPQNEVLVEEATRMVSQLRAKEDLKMACNIREVPALERAIRRAKKVNDGKAMDIQIILASQLLKRLNRIERLSQTVLQINQNALVEMKKYVTPPPGVHESLHATFLVLGEEPALLTTWKSCQSLLFKTGKENIMRRISTFNPKLVSKNAAATAKKIIAPYSVLQIRDASLGASAFYVWVKGMIGEIETTGKHGPRPERVRSNRQLAPRSAVLLDDTIERADTIIMMM